MPKKAKKRTSHRANDQYAFTFSLTRDEVTKIDVIRGTLTDQYGVTISRTEVIKGALRKFLGGV